MQPWTRVLSYFRPDLARILFALGLMVASILASIAKPWPVAIVLDSLIGDKPFPNWLPAGLKTAGLPLSIAFFAGMVFLLHALQGGLTAWQNYLSINVGLKGLSRLRNQLFGWMQKLSLAFYQRANQGDLIYRATWDTYALQTLFQHGLFKFLNALGSVLLMLGVMWQLNARLMLVTLGIFPPLVLTMYFFGKAMNRRSLAAHQADSKVTSLVQQNITSLPLIQSYTREKIEQERFENQVASAQRKRGNQHGWEVLYWLIIAILFGLATALLTWWGAHEIVARRLTVGELVIFLAYLGQLYDPLNQLSHVGATVSDANAGLHRIFELLDTKEDLRQPKNPVPVYSPTSRTVAGIIARGNLRFENVSFGYVEKQEVLRGINLEIAAGEVLGIVGPSGSGKTTLLNLLPRFFDPVNGRVLLEGKDLRELDLHQLREQIGYVFQESFLLPATIMENIGAGRAGSSNDEIMEAAKLAGAHEFIQRLPEGYETLVGEGAARLSVGEKQRINIARAFLKNAPILLLDEPTSALDAETEFSVVQSLAKLLENRTVLLVAHRLSTLRRVNRVVVLERGQISECGTREALLARDGYFARMSRQDFGKI